jgi:hypothetical protein
MFEKLRLHTFNGRGSLLIVAACIMHAPLSEASETERSTPEAVCNNQGECSLDLSDVAVDSTELCDAPSAWISWNTKHKGIYFISCECDCTSHDNSGWLVSFNSSPNPPSVQKVTLGKRYTLEKFHKAPSMIVDILAPHLMCEASDPEKWGASIFVSLIKRPTDKLKNPYCFYPAYILFRNGSITVQSNDRDDDYGKRLYESENDQETKNQLINIIKKSVPTVTDPIDTAPNEPFDMEGNKQ